MASTTAWTKWNKCLPPSSLSRVQDFCQLLGIAFPIIQAPMLGTSTPEMAAQVSLGGGLGSIGLSFCSQMEISNDINRVATSISAQFTSKKMPLNVNFFCHRNPPLPFPKEKVQIIADVLRPSFKELDMLDTLDTIVDSFESKSYLLAFSRTELEAILQSSTTPRVVSFHFGLPDDLGLVQVLKAAGILVCSSATTVEEAKFLEQAGVDFIIAQGAEAGGHRGWFLREERGIYKAGCPTMLEGQDIGTFALVSQVVDAVSVPVVAAGGIVDSRGIVAALSLGASAVQLGTAFLCCPEAASSSVYRKALQEAASVSNGAQPMKSTCLIQGFTGRHARGLINDFALRMDKVNINPEDFPLWNVFTKPLRKRSTELGNPHYLSLWRGQNPANFFDIPARKVVEALIEGVASFKG